MFFQRVCRKLGVQAYIPFRWKNFFYDAHIPGRDYYIRLISLANHQHSAIEEDHIAWLVRLPAPLPLFPTSFRGKHLDTDTPYKV